MVSLAARIRERVCPGSVCILEESVSWDGEIPLQPAGMGSSSGGGGKWNTLLGSIRQQRVLSPKRAEPAELISDSASLLFL